ncbi:YciI family protein [Paenibacillus sp. GP183]|uniref:YciI family protein n=1 Tax=Paenibacillus sp. GP183 TaxID=1882751 RepID=UPI000896F035|nr:YciI family protein [Paenibacillus sp. GP183]SEC59865.1 Uncharacterized conserved protein [Paenibacillus sp. GP183]
MKYMILTYESQEDFEARTDSKRQEQYWAGWKDYGGAMKEAGVISSMHGLQPRNMATTVQLIDRELQVQEGPYADTKDQLGGYFIIDVPDINKAIEWAARCPAAATGAVEVRPVM